MMPNKHVLPFSLDSSSPPICPYFIPGQGLWAPGPARLWDKAALMDTALASNPPCWDFTLGKAGKEDPQLTVLLSCLLPKAFQKQLPEIPWAQGIALGLSSLVGDAFICKVT